MHVPSALVGSAAIAFMRLVASGIVERHVLDAMLLAHGIRHFS